MVTKQTTFGKSTACPICDCRVMVRKHATLKPRLMTALALANHVKTMHGAELRKVGA